MEKSGDVVISNEFARKIESQLDELNEKQKQLSLALAKKKGFSLAFENDENEERGNWTGKFDFFLSCLGYAVGLGNVWRFPYLCYKNGGGAFFIPYCIFLFLCGMPIFLMELSIGQFTSSGPLTCWEMAPLFKGLGVSMVLVSALVAIYYNIIISWALWYLFASFNKELPWAKCGSWSTELCSDKLTTITKEQCVAPNFTRHDTNGTCYFTNQMYSNSSYLYGLFNKTLAKENDISERTPSNEYLNYVGLQDKLGDITNVGPLRWDMSLALLLAWIIVFLSLSRGIKSSGKVVYFTALFPYVVLIILLVRGLTLPGYEKGITFYLTPDVSRLSDSQVWKDAAVQIFFSLSASWGGLITLASYNRFKTDCVRDAITVSLANCATSVFAGFVVFSFLGYLAHELDTDVTNVVDSGVALAFIVYPQAVTKLPVSPLWAILFFIMLITLGLDSEFALMETVVTAVIDLYPKVLRRFKTLVILAFSIIFFLIGLCMATPGGPQILTVFDDYSGGWNIMVIAILECVCVFYVYGVRRFFRDIEAMSGSIVCGCLPWNVIKYWFAFCWGIATPGLMAFAMIFSWVKFSPSKYGGTVLPDWAQAIGWILTLSVLSCIFIMAIYLIIVTPGSFPQRIKTLVNPSKYWGPALVKFRKEITYVENFDVDPWGTGAGRDSFEPEFTDIAEKGGYDNNTFLAEKL